MFSTFLDGWVSVGLLLLRLGGGAGLVIQGLAHFGHGDNSGFLPLAVISVMSAGGLLLLIGFLTRFAAVVSVLACLGCIFSWLPISNVGPFVIPTTAAMSAIICAAVVCMGPGAFSVDAQLFGRRVIIIPRKGPKE